MKLQNKIIVVTGGNGLIGKAIRAHLQINGAVAVNAEVTIETRPEKDDFNCDITSEDSIEKAIQCILERYGRIDGWVNNAYPRTSDWGVHFEDIKFSSWQKNIDMQLNSVFNCCKRVLRVMAEQKSGSIVNISSIYGLVGPDFNIYEGTAMTMPAAYSAIKGGVNSFTRYLASYFGHYGIRVNCVSPGGVFDGQSETFIANYNKRVPLKRMATPDDISPAVSFLLSDEATYITGQNIVVDGGWTTI